MSDARNKLKGLLWLMLTIAVGLAFAYGLNPLIALTPWSVETALSRVFSVHEGAVACRGPANSERMLKKIETRLRSPDAVPHSFPFDFAVHQSATAPMKVFLASCAVLAYAIYKLI